MNKDGNYMEQYLGYAKHLSADQEIGMAVGDNEMEKLGYVNVEDLKDEFNFGTLYKDKYIYKEDIKRLENKNDIRLWSVLDLFDFDSNMKANFNFDITSSINNFKSYLFSKENGKDYFRLVGENYSRLAGENCSTLVVGNNSTLAGGNNSRLVGGYYSVLSGGNNSKLVSGDCSKLASGDNSRMVGGDNSILTSGYNSRLVGRYNSTLVGRNSSTLVGGNRSTLVGGNRSKLVGGYDSKMVGGDNSIIVGDNESKAKGGIGSVITLVTRDWDRNIIDFKSAQIDGTTLKADTFYKLRDGVFVETE